MTEKLDKVKSEYDELVGTLMASKKEANEKKAEMDAQRAQHLADEAHAHVLAARREARRAGAGQPVLHQDGRHDGQPEGQEGLLRHVAHRVQHA